MAQEIERKFLVKNNNWKALATGLAYCQGYIPTVQSGRSVRVRTAGTRGYLTLKGPIRGTQGLTRSEFEYEIPLGDAQQMLETLCAKPLIEKTRYRLPLGDVIWDIDEFAGENAGLIVAEVELHCEDQPFERPEWLGEEVSGKPQYYNASLVKYPYSQWPTP
ncbi:MAG: CYTH domain-containing protein [Phormidesmis sp. RL_2_1]|nr:CYTH domain-containing protein [Phormidesmis sp. RL_2_1]